MRPPRNLLYRPFLDALRAEADQRGRLLNNPRMNFIQTPDIVPGVHIGVSVTHTRNRQLIRVSLTIANDRERIQREKLDAERQAIDDAVGLELDWGDNRTNEKSTVRASLQADIFDEEDWPRQINWVLQTIEVFEREFSRFL